MGYRRARADPLNLDRRTSPQVELIDADASRDTWLEGLLGMSFGLERTGSGDGPEPRLTDLIEPGSLL